MSERKSSFKPKDEKASSASSTPQKDKKTDHAKDEKEDTPSKVVASEKKEKRISTAKRPDSEHGTPAKDDKANQKDKKKEKIKYEDVMDPDDPLTMVKELLLQQAAETVSDDELQVSRPSSFDFRALESLLAFSRFLCTSINLPNNF